MAVDGEHPGDDRRSDALDLPGAFAVGMSGAVRAHEAEPVVPALVTGAELAVVPRADIAVTSYGRQELTQPPDIMVLGARPQTAILRASVRAKRDLYVKKDIRRDLLMGTTMNGAALGVANSLSTAVEERPTATKGETYDREDVSDIPGLNIILLSKMRHHGPGEARRYLESARRDHRRARLGAEAARQAWEKYGGDLVGYFDTTRPPASFSSAEIGGLGGMQSDVGGHILEALVDKITNTSRAQGGRRVTDHTEFTRLLGIRADRLLNNTGEGDWEDRRARQGMADKVDAERDKSDGKILIISRHPAILMAAFALPDTTEIHVRGVSPDGQTSLLFEQSTGAKYPPQPSYEKYSRQYQRIICSIPRYYEPSRLLDKLGGGGMLVLTGDMEDDRYIDDVLVEMESRVVAEILDGKPRMWDAIPMWDGDVEVIPSIDNREVRAEFPPDGKRYASLCIFRRPFDTADYRIVSEAARLQSEER